MPAFATTALFAFLSSTALAAPANVPLSLSPDDAEYWAPFPAMTKNTHCDLDQFNKTIQLEFAAVGQSDGAYGYLMGIDGKTAQQPGTCAQVSCAWGLSVHFCAKGNDVARVSWPDIANATNAVAMTCFPGKTLKQTGEQYFPLTGNNGKTNGQKLSDDGTWSVYLQGWNC